MQRTRFPRPKRRGVRSARKTSQCARFQRRTGGSPGHEVLGIYGFPKPPQTPVLGRVSIAQSAASVSAFGLSVFRRKTSAAGNRREMAVDSGRHGRNRHGVRERCTARGLTPGRPKPPDLSRLSRSPVLRSVDSEGWRESRQSPEPEGIAWEATQETHSRSRNGAGLQPTRSQPDEAERRRSPVSRSVGRFRVGRSLSGVGGASWRLRTGGGRTRTIRSGGN